MTDTATRREIEREQRRELLLSAAERVFGRKTFDEATMQEVAAEAQIGMQGLYEHFASKQLLYETLIKVRVRRIQKMLDDALEGVADPIERLRIMARIQTRAFTEAPAFFTVFFRERQHYDWGCASRFRPFLHRIYRDEQKRLKGILEECVKSGALEPLDPDFLVQACLNAWEASLHYFSRHRPEEEIETCVSRTMDTFLFGLGARP